MQRDFLGPVAAELKAIGPVRWDGPVPGDDKGNKIETDILPAAPAPLPDATPLQVEEPTIRESQIVQEYEEVAAQAPLQEAKPLQVEEATTRNSRIVQENEDVRPDDATLRNVAMPKKRASDLTPSERAHILGPKIPHSEDERIFRERESGKAIRDIAEDLRKEGYDATPANVQARYYEVKKQHARKQAHPTQPKATQEPSQPGVEGAHDTARANPRGTPKENPEPTSISGAELDDKTEMISKRIQTIRPTSISRAELDDKIWKAWKAGKTPNKISDDLCAGGLYYGEGSVKRRLRQQGAEL